MYNSKKVNVSGIQISRAQFLALHLRKVMLKAANIYMFVRLFSAFNSWFFAILYDVFNQ